MYFFAAAAMMRRTTASSLPSSRALAQRLRHHGCSHGSDRQPTAFDPGKFRQRKKK
jgi:hypothetical protein